MLSVPPLFFKPAPRNPFYPLLLLYNFWFRLTPDLCPPSRATLLLTPTPFPHCVDGLSPVKLQGLPKGHAKRLHEFFLGRFLAVHTRNLFNPADPPRSRLFYYCRVGLFYVHHQFSQGSVNQTLGLTSAASSTRIRSISQSSSSSDSLTAITQLAFHPRSMSTVTGSTFIDSDPMSPTAP